MKNAKLACTRWERENVRREALHGVHKERLDRQDYGEVDGQIYGATGRIAEIVLYLRAVTVLYAGIGVESTL